MKVRLFALSAILVLLAAVCITPSAKAEIVCEEAILIWSWTHGAWICSLSDGGGTVCTLCSDETDATPDEDIAELDIVGTSHRSA